MDVYIARQPIFDRRMRIFGYELLYRTNENNFYTGTDDDEATTELIHNSFLVMGLNDLTDGTKAFINFSKDLINSDVPLMLPRKSIVVEVLERQAATQATVAACRKIRGLGYMLALDDFVFDKENVPLIETANIIKVDFPSMDINRQQEIIREYGPEVKFLAEKIETREDYHRAVQIGYDYFQGYFFCKPSVIKTREIASPGTNLFRLMEELNAEEPDNAKIVEIIETDLGLSYKLLKLANSVYAGSRHPIKSIPHALSFLGTNEMYQWVTLILLKDLQTVEYAELIKMSLIRGRFMEYLARELHTAGSPSEYFLTGILSFIDVILGKPMEKVMSGLPLSEPVKAALRGEDNDEKRLLDCVIDYETANWSFIDERYPLDILGINRFTAIYVEALKWAKKLNY